MKAALVLMAAAAGALVARPALAQMQHDMSAMSPGWTFTAAGQAFLNLTLQHRKFDDINRIESQHKSVQIVGASPIVRALLLLIGVSPRHFVKKPQ